jgi:tRNA G18 (ribose-2'-O)-methylase SpoU
MRDRVKTTPDLSLASEAHQEAKQNRDYRLWERNVADHFKDKTEEEIKATLKATANPFAVCFENWTNDFNMATGIRNANAFNAREVFYLGIKRWDRRGAVGVHNYTEVQFLSDMEDFKKLGERYVIVGVDNVPGSVPIDSYPWAKNSLLVFGEEGVGLTPGIQALCKDIVHINMYGSVRSFNCGTASGIAMYSFCSKVL